MGKPLAWAEVDLSAIRHNVEKIRSHTGNRPVIGVVKADAYGHGAIEVARLFETMDARMLAVACIEEGIQLVEAGIRTPILVFESEPDAAAPDYVKWGLVPTVARLEFARRLSRAAGKKTVPVHVTVDTGMGTVGPWHEEAADFVKAVASLPGLAVEGLYTHFAAADGTEAVAVEFTRAQASRFAKVVAELEAAGARPPLVHAANSAAIRTCPESHFDAVRPGISVYGIYWPNGAGEAMRPAMSVRCRPLLAEAKMIRLPVGFAHGFSVRCANGGEVLLGERRAKILRVDQDEMQVEAPPGTKLARTATALVFGIAGEERLDVAELARVSGTIAHEILCRAGTKLPRVYEKG